MEVTLYSTTTCPYCKLLKDYLSGKQIAFREKLIDQDEAARVEMEAVSGGFLGVPFTVIVKDDGTRQTVTGFDRGKFEAILGVYG